MAKTPKIDDCEDTGLNISLSDGLYAVVQPLDETEAIPTSILHQEDPSLTPQKSSVESNEEHFNKEEAQKLDLIDPNIEHINNNQILGTIDKGNNDSKNSSTFSPKLAMNSNDSSNDPRKSIINEKKERKGTRMFLEGVLHDLTNKDLLPLKILFFFKYATLYVLYPFLPLHLKSLGMSSTEAGINSALIPIFVILAPPFSGMLADKIGNFKLFLTGLTVLNAPLALALLLVPPAREILHLPTSSTFEFACGNSASSSLQSTFILKSLEIGSCKLNSKLNPDENSFLLNFPNSPIESAIECGEICVSGALSDPKTAQLYVSTENQVFNESIPAQIFLLPDLKSIFKPNPYKIPKIDCSSHSCKFEIVEHLTLESTKIQLQQLKIMNGNEHDFFPVGNWTVLDSATNDTKNLGNSKCENVRTVPKSSCRDACLVQIQRQNICKNPTDEKVYSVALTFGLYTLLRILLGVASATSFIMFEGAVLAILKEFGGDYGLQRVTATLAAIMFAPLSGTLIQWFGGFYPAFYLYGILQVGSGLLTLKIDLDFKRPTDNIFHHVKEVLSQVEVIIFFAAMLLSGTSWGYLESFLFWFLEDLGGSNLLMGLTISIGGLCGIPVLILSRPIIKRFGHVNILCVGLLFYAIRLFGYSFIVDPWLCLPFEGMEAFTASLAITAAATYAAALSSPQTIASIQGIWGGLYFGFGRGIGSLLGGFFHKWYGARTTFRIFSLVSLLGGLIYYTINLTYLQKYSKQLRKTSGLNLHDIRGDRAKRGDEATIGAAVGSIDEKRSDHKWGYNGPCEVDFHDIPLDEEIPSKDQKFKENVIKS